MTSTKTAKDITIAWQEFDINRVSLTDLEENTRSKGQRTAFPRYDHPTLGANAPIIIQCPWFELDCYGIPRKSDYYKDDSQRMFNKNPLNQNIDEIKAFSENVPIAIDNWASSDEFKKKLFGDKHNKYKEYQSCFRLPQEEEEDTKPKKDKKVYPRHPYMKFKIDTTYPENKIRTVVFTSIMENGKRIRNKVEGIETIDEFSNYLTYKCRYRPIIRLVKFWAQPSNMKEPTFGFTFKLIKVEIEPAPKKGTDIREFLEADTFLDSDKESDKEETKLEKPKKEETSKAVAAPSASSKKIAQVDSSSESESESESEEPIKVVTKTTKPVAKKVVESESDEESDEPKVVKKPAAKKIGGRKANA
jgi:hypothetical protein